MKISSKTHRLYRIQQVIFYVLLVAVVVMLAKLSISTNVSTDWTANSRHTLSATTTDFLQQIDQQITVQIFVTPNSEYRPAIQSLLDRYLLHSDKLQVSYINPDFSPELVRQLNIQQQGEMVVSHGNKQQHVYDLSEQSLTNALISVSRDKEQWLVFIEGHGERSPLDQANFNFSVWAEQLKLKGFKFKALNLVEHSQIPDNTAVVIIASPEKSWLAGEIALMQDYINQGGNLLWLAEPESNQYLASLAEQLDIEFIAGTVIDPNATLLGINDPRFVLISDYANHPVGAATNTVTLFPQAVAIEQNNPESEWLHVALLNSQENTWSESESINENEIQDLQYNIGIDTAGPLSLGYLLSRANAEQEDTEQRIAVIGDGDFLSNTYIGNAGNLALGMALINWLTEDDALISIPVKTTVDSQLNLSRSASILIGLGFLIALPVLLLAIGFVIWWKRRR